MKNLLCIFVVILVTTLVISCADSGTTSLQLSGTEEKLPDELKGLKIYNVVADGSDVKVAILNGQINSLHSSRLVGKIMTYNNVIIVNKTKERSSRMIEVSDIISETDSILVIRKK